MKLKLLLFVALSVLSTTLYSQIKIGDNPQNLDPASVLELESTNRVFVITRITTVEMNAINPLQGAMIYNTDEQCLYYFDGTEWINLCDALRLTFTSDPIFNDYSTIVITESEDNINFEVREIRGQNIVDFTITSVDIQNNAITSSKLAPDSVGNEELQDNTVSDAEIDYAQVTLNDFTNDAGFITSASIVSADVGNTIIAGSDNGAFYDVTPVQNALDALDVAVTTISLIDNGDGTYNFSDSVGNIQLITTNGLTVTNTVAGNLIATVTLADGTTLNINETITSLTDNGDGLITYTKEDGSQETVAKADITDLGDGTYTFTNNDGSDVTLNTNGLTVTNTIPGNLIATLTLADGSNTDVNETITSLIDNGDGFITYTTEEGLSETVAKADITDLGDGTYTFTNNDGSDVTLNTNGLTITNTVAGNLIATLILADGSSTAVNETITSLIDNGDGFVTYTKEDGTQDTVAKADITDNLDGTYTFTNNDGIDVTLNFNAAALPFDNTILGNLLATDVQAAIDEVSTAVAGGSDNQVISTDGTPGNIDLEDGGGPITINVEDGDFDDTNELNTSIAMNAGALEITDAGGPLSEPLISVDVNNDIIFGSDGRLYINVDTAASGETTTNLVDNGDGSFTYTNEIGTPQLVFKADVTDIGDGTYTFTNNDGSDETIDTRAASNPYDNTVVGLLTATDVQAALDELAGGADSQNISTDNTPGNISIDNGNTLVLNVDDADADPANENQTVSAGTGINVNQVGQNFEVVNAAPDQTVTLADGGSGNITVGGTYPNLTVDVASLNDADSDPANENQTVSAGTGINVNQVGQNFEVVNAAPDQTVTLADGGSGNISVGGTYPNLTVDVASLNDADSNPANELQTLSQVGTNVTLSNGGGTISVIDNDNDPANENQTVSAGTGINVNQVGQNFEVVNAAPDQTVTLADGGSGNVTIGGTYPNLTVDVVSLNDADSDPANENQTVSAGTGINVNQVGQNFEVVNAAPDQTVTLADGGNGNVTIGGTYPNLTVDVPDNNDNDPTNENQTVSAGTGINVNQVGQNFEVINAAPDQTVTLADGGNGNVTIGGTYPNLTVDIPDNNDNDPTNEIQDASQVIYDGTTSGLSAINTQAAIDEIAALNPGANLSNINLTQTTGGNRFYNLAGGNLIFSGAVGNVGVGDLGGAPTEKFDVNGKIRARTGFVANFGSGGSPSYSFIGDTGTGLFRPLANQLGISTGGLQAMRIDDNQNVGIQETSPTSTLHVSGSVATAVLEGSGAINLNDTHHTVLFTANGSIVLPSAALSPGRIYIIKNPSFTVGSNSYLDGSGTAQTSIPSGGSIWLQSIGGNWHQIN